MPPCIVTNRCLADAREPAEVTTVIAAANTAEPVPAGLISAILPRLG